MEAFAMSLRFKTQFFALTKCSITPSQVCDGLVGGGYLKKIVFVMVEPQQLILARSLV